MQAVNFTNRFNFFFIVRVTYGELEYDFLLISFDSDNAFVLLFDEGSTGEWTNITSMNIEKKIQCIYFHTQVQGW